MRLAKDILAIIFFGIAEVFDTLGHACEDHSGDITSFTIHTADGYYRQSYELDH